jgi:hypothetical protein
MGSKTNATGLALLREERGQVSAELIIVMAAVLAVALVLVSSLQDTSKEGAEQVSKKTKKVIEEIGRI